MQFTTLLFSILPVVALAAPAAIEVRQAPTWELTKISRSCNYNVCDYQFNVIEKGADAGVCSIKGIKGPNTNIDPDTSCGPDGRFKVSGGWSGDDFITIVVKDITNNKWSFFGVTDDEFNTGRFGPHVSSVATIGIFP